VADLENVGGDEEPPGDIEIPDFLKDSKVPSTDPVCCRVEMINSGETDCDPNFFCTSLAITVRLGGRKYSCLIYSAVSDAFSFVEVSPILLAISA